jgi:hypothetical protein
MGGRTELRDRQNGLENYLNILRYAKATPNFVCAVDYLLAAGAKVEGEKGALVVWLPDDQGNWDIFLPPAGRSQDIYKKGAGVVFPSAAVLTDIEGYNPGPGFVRQFWDYEFIYSPLAFKDLSGGQWKIFRKNVNRFERLHAPEYRKLEPGEAHAFWLDWLGSQQDTLISDFDAINKYLLTDRGHRWGLMVDDNLVGINVWDENYMYINFRYCFSLPEYRYANEFLRLKFYTSPEISGGGKLIHDGGSMGFETLHKFKMKLNPREVRKRFTWLPTTDKKQRQIYL